MCSLLGTGIPWVPEAHHGQQNLLVNTRKIDGFTMSGIRVLLISWVAFGSLEIKQMAFRVFAEEIKVSVKKYAPSVV